MVGGGKRPPLSSPSSLDIPPRIDVAVSDAKVHRASNAMDFGCIARPVYATYEFQVNSLFSISRRYSDVRQLHDSLPSNIRNMLPNFPRKLLWGSALPESINQRRDQFQRYFEGVSAVYRSVACPVRVKQLVWSFFSDGDAMTIQRATDPMSASLSASQIQNNSGNNNMTSDAAMIKNSSSSGINPSAVSSAEEILYGKPSSEEEFIKYRDFMLNKGSFWVGHLPSNVVYTPSEEDKKVIEIRDKVGNDDAVDEGDGDGDGDDDGGGDKTKLKKKDKEKSSKSKKKKEKEALVKAEAEANQKSPNHNELCTMYVPAAAYASLKRDDWDVTLRNFVYEVNDHSYSNYRVSCANALGTAAVFGKKRGSGSKHTIYKSYFEIDALPSLVFFAIYDMKARTGWDKTVGAIERVYQRGDVDDTVFVKFDGMMMVAGRCFFDDRRVYQSSSNDSYILLARTSTQPRKPLPSKDLVWAENVLAGQLVVPHPLFPSTSSLVISIGQCDIGGNIPPAVVNTMAKKVPLDWFDGLAEACRNLKKDINYYNK